ncbi:MAG TPA: hypothetical protein VHN14_26160 [Kofleriaceae bacterium]|nr:hypothetical protein [Kofleriaceae bacterium]
MTRIAGASVFFGILVATTACGVGGDDDGGFTGGTDPKPGIVCSASFKINGTFAPIPAGSPGARPQDPEDPTKLLAGCWPAGTWTFTAAVADNQCPTAPAVLPSYSFKVDRMEGADMQGLVDTYTNTTSVGAMQWHLSVSSNGQGCEGNFEFGTMDGKDYWNMQPVLLNPPNATDPPTTTITGQGDYDEYNNDGWPWK